MMYDGNGIRKIWMRSILVSGLKTFFFNLFQLKLIAGTFSFFKEPHVNIPESPVD